MSVNTRLDFSYRIFCIVRIVFTTIFGFNSFKRSFFICRSFGNFNCLTFCIVGIEINLKTAVINNKNSRLVRLHFNFIVTVHIKNFVAVENICKLCVAACVKTDSFNTVCKVECNKNSLIVGSSSVNKLFVLNVYIFKIAVLESLKRKSYNTEFLNMLKKFVVRIRNGIKVKTGAKLIIAVGSSHTLNAEFTSVVN